jgi:hypothetical protein
VDALLKGNYGTGHRDLLCSAAKLTKAKRRSPAVSMAAAG